MGAIGPVTTEARFGLYLNRDRQLNRTAWAVYEGAVAVENLPTVAMHCAVAETSDEGRAAAEEMKAMAQLAREQLARERMGESE